MLAKGKALIVKPYSIHLGIDFRYGKDKKYGKYKCISTKSMCYNKGVKQSHILNCRVYYPEGFEFNIEDILEIKEVYGVDIVNGRPWIYVYCDSFWGQKEAKKEEGYSPYVGG